MNEHVQEPAAVREASPLIRHRLLTILLLGAIVSALSVGALARLLTVSTQHRIERAREEVNELLSRLAQDGTALSDPAPGNVVGMRAGLSDGRTPLSAPGRWRPELERALKESASTNPRTKQVALESSNLVLGTVRAADGRVGWAALEVRPLPHLETWKFTIWLLAFATIVLVATTMRAAVSMQRDASALGQSLSSLARDLSAPVARPALRELGDVADGIVQLARRLADARREEARLAEELSRNERLAALGRVAAGVAHEVRNPLASIKLRLDLAMAGSRLPDSVRDAISHASAEILRLDRLVADLLVVAGRSTGPQVRLSLSELTRARCEVLRPWAAERHVELRVDGDASVSAHADSLARALDNLIRNAVEASSPESTVAIRISEDEGRAKVSVRDRGPGVEAQRASELFEPFFTTKPDGTGLGLPLARSIAQAHGGDVRYVRVDAETRFEVELPLASENGAPPRSPEAESELRFHS
ncbi:MAG TPA: ATP-binding protein [Polyangiaceae bacterium]|nr:ATP-binding protein [Polyangiaceae bacterium]